MKRRVGFTLIELLVVVAIIGILVTLLLPALSRIRESARRIQCRKNLDQLATAIHSFHGIHDRVPYGANFASAIGGTWVTSILPHVDGQTAYNKFDLNVAIYDAANVEAVQTVISTLICPSDSASSDPLRGGRVQTGSRNPGPSMGLWYPGSMGPTRDGTSPAVACVYCSEGVGSYCCADTGDYGSGGGSGKPGVGMFTREEQIVTFSSVHDGMESTFLLGETLPTHCTFNGAYNHNFPIAGTSIPLNTMEQGTDGVNDKWYTACGFKSAHTGGAHFAMVGGSVHYVSDTIDYRVYNLLGSRADFMDASLPE